MHPKTLSSRTRRSFGSLEKFKELFEGRLGLMPGEPYSLKLKPNTEPVHTRPFPIPQKHLKLIKDDVNCLIELGVLRQAIESEWAAPSFRIQKKTTPFVLYQILQVSTNML